MAEAGDPLEKQANPYTSQKGMRGQSRPCFSGWPRAQGQRPAGGVRAPGVVAEGLTHPLHELHLATGVQGFMRPFGLSPEFSKRLREGRSRCDLETSKPKITNQGP